MNSSIEFQSQFDSSSMVGNSGFMANKKKWLKSLLKGKYFRSCDEHEDRKKNDKNAFCIDCEQVLCQHCVIEENHQTHQLLQIRRYVYHNVVREDDMQRYFDCSKLQLYVLNGADVVFLNPRPQPKITKTGCNCECCGRHLTHPSRYCSIACKFSVITSNSPDSLSFVTERRNGNSSEFLSENEYQEEEVNCEEEGCHRFSEMLKTKKKLNKRKGIPRRAPFF